MLARQVSAIHAATVIHRLKTLNCPSQQKLALLDSIINTAKTTAGNRDHDPVPGCFRFTLCMRSILNSRLHHKVVGVRIAFSTHRAA